MTYFTYFYDHIFMNLTTILTLGPNLKRTYTVLKSLLYYIPQAVQLSMLETPPKRTRHNTFQNRSFFPMQTSLTMSTLLPKLTLIHT